MIISNTDLYNTMRYMQQPWSMAHYYILIITYTLLHTHYYILIITYSLLHTHYYILIITYSLLHTHYYIIIIALKFNSLLIEPCNTTARYNTGKAIPLRA